MDGAAVGQEPETVLENPPSVKKGYGHPKNTLEAELEAAEGGAGGVGNLLEQLVLPKREDGNQRSPGKKKRRGRGGSPKPDTPQKKTPSP